MELKIYDTNLDLIGIIDTEKAVIWNRKYYTAGEFEVHVPANEIEISLIQKQNIVTKDGSVEFGIIENVTIEKTEDGEFIKASGRFGSSLLARRIVFDTTVLSTTVENAMRTLVNDNAIDISIGDRVITGLELGVLNGYTETVSFQVSYRNLLTTLSGLSETSGIGFLISFDTVNKKFKFETYKAFDRSINQSVNPRAIFSNDYDNLLESIYQTSDIEYSNVALVGGEGEGESRKMVVVGSASGLDRYEVFVNAKDIRMVDGITEPEYYQMLGQKGAESLMPKVEYFEGNVLAEGTMIYKEDYDLGDIITIENTKWGKRINVQITEITEVYDDNGMQITPVFGQATQTLGEVLSGKEDTSGSGSSGSVVVTPNRAMVSDATGNASASNVTDTELGYLSGVTGAIQAQINGKQATITGAASTIVSSNLTANRALLSNASGKVAVSAVTDTELGYLSGLTSAIQAQLNNKLGLSGGTLSGDLTAVNLFSQFGLAQLKAITQGNGYPLSNVPSGNANNAIDTGWYNYTEGNANTPTTYGSILTLRRTDNTKFQIAFSTTGLMYFRSTIDGITWNPWVMLSTVESGSFTPTVYGSSTAGVATYTTRNGKYTKICNRVFFDITLVWTGHTGTGGLRYSGLPFTVRNISPVFNVKTVNMTLSTNGYNIQSYASVNSTTLEVVQYIGTVDSWVPMDTNAGIQISGSYETD
ncbi:MAG: hypothetical protein WHF31_15185 [Candidatus Dehalobacter alkaniphilus]